MRAGGAMLRGLAYEYDDVAAMLEQVYTLSSSTISAARFPPARF